MGENNGKNEKRENNAKSLVSTRKNELHSLDLILGRRNPIEGLTITSIILQSTRRRFYEILKGLAL